MALTPEQMQGIAAWRGDVMGRIPPEWRSKFLEAVQDPMKLGYFDMIEKAGGPSRDELTKLRITYVYDQVRNAQPGDARYSAQDRAMLEQWENELLQIYSQSKGMRDAKAAQAGEAQQRQDITGQIQAFIDNLRGPLNDDPVYQQIAKQAINAAQAQAGRAGMSGRSGLAATNAAAVTQTTSAPYYQARQQALAGGLALQNQRDLGLGQLQAQKAALESQLAKDTWAAQQNAAQGVGAAIGGGIGALGFIGGPVLGAATMGAGAAIGGGLGGMVGAPQAPNFSLSQGRSSRPGVNPYTGY